MLCLSKYRVRVCPVEIFSESILKILCRKSQQKTATENPFPLKLWGGVICGVVGCAENIQIPQE